MRRLLKAASLAALVCACSGTESATPVGNLLGTYDVALVGDLLFITSADTDELRVLELSDRPQYIRAPNPLEPLGLTVIERPTDLTADSHFAGDAVAAGPYLYARSPGGKSISSPSWRPTRRCSKRSHSSSRASR
jgi:hypothetical protein